MSQSKPIVILLKNKSDEEITQYQRTNPRNISTEKTEYYQMTNQICRRTTPQEISLFLHLMLQLLEKSMENSGSFGTYLKNESNMNENEKQELMQDLNKINDDIYQLNSIITDTIKNNKNDSPDKIDIKKQLKIYQQITKSLEKHHALPESLNLSRVCTQLQPKPYMKLYMQQNATHDSDREKAGSLISNIIVKKLKKNSQNLLFGICDQDESQERNLDLNTNTLVHLGQAPKNEMDLKQESSTAYCNNQNEQTLKPKTLKQQLEMQLTRRQSKSLMKERPNPNIYKNMTIDHQSMDIFFQKRDSSVSVTQRKEERPLFKSLEANDDAGSPALPEIKIFAPRDKIDSNSILQTEQTSPDRPEKRTKKMKNMLLSQTTAATKHDSKRDSEDQLTKSNTQQSINEKLKSTIKQVKNLQLLITMMQQYKLKQSYLKRNHHHDIIEIPEEHKFLFEPELKKKQPSIQQIKNLPLKQKLESIQEYNIEPHLILTEMEMKICKINEDLSIPEKIKMSHLRNLFHKQQKKVNRWIVTSLKGDCKFEFDYFMANDKTIVDKNSLQYQKIELEKEKRKKKIEDQQNNGGFIDPNMKTLELSDQKVINDICNKYQFKKTQLVPLYDQKKNEADITNVSKLHEQLIREHEEVEKKMRIEKEKQYFKWKKINQDYKNRQATLGQNTSKQSLTPQPRKASSKNIVIDIQQHFPQQETTGEEKKQQLKEKFQNYFREKEDKIRSQQLVKDLDKEITQQNKMLKNISKDLDEFEYIKQKKNKGEIAPDKDVPDDFYVKSGKSKMFSKNIAIWKQQEIYNDLHGDFENFRKKYRILQK